MHYIQEMLYLDQFANFQNIDLYNVPSLVIYFWRWSPKNPQKVSRLWMKNHNEECISKIQTLTQVFELKLQHRKS